MARSSLRRRRVSAEYFVKLTDGRLCVRERAHVCENLYFIFVAHKLHPKRRVRSRRRRVSDSRKCGKENRFQRWIFECLIFEENDGKRTEEFGIGRLTLSSHDSLGELSACAAMTI